MLCSTKLCCHFVVILAVVIGLVLSAQAADEVEVVVAMDNSKPIAIQSHMPFKISLKNKSAEGIPLFNKENVDFTYGLAIAKIELTTSDGWRAADIYSVGGGKGASFLPVGRFWSTLEPGGEDVRSISVRLSPIYIMEKDGKQQAIILGSGASGKCTVKLKIMKRLIAPPLRVEQIGGTGVATDIVRWSETHAGYLYESEAFPIEIAIESASKGQKER